LSVDESTEIVKKLKLVCQPLSITYSYRC
jgi:hypothetical protein